MKSYPQLIQTLNFICTHYICVYLYYIYYMYICIAVYYIYIYAHISHTCILYITRICILHIICYMCILHTLCLQYVT